VELLGPVEFLDPAELLGPAEFLGPAELLGPAEFLDPAELLGLTGLPGLLDLTGLPGLLCHLAPGAENRVHLGLNPATPVSADLDPGPTTFPAERSGALGA
jgi:hypothetical protein